MMVRNDHTYCRGYTFAGLVFAAVLAISTPAATDTFFLPAVIENDLVITSENSPCVAQNNVTILEGGSLTITSGVTFYMDENVTLAVRGSLIIEGTANQPVTIASGSVLPESRWKRIEIEASAGAPAPVVNIVHAIISGASIHQEDNAAIYARNDATLILDFVTFTDGYAAIDQSGGTLIVRDCTFAAGMLGEDIHARYASVTIERSTFGGGLSDTIDLESVTAASIIDCTILSADDDGIDVGESSHNVTITGTHIYGCIDKGISVGQSSEVTVEGCVIADSQEGVTVFDGSSANIDRSTVIGTDYGIYCKEDDNLMNGNGGSAIVTNTIIGGSVVIDEWSTASFSYCLSDVTHLGTGNVYGDPQFFDANGRDFRLLSDSPAINAASPALGNDPDGSPADIGAFTFFPQSLVINEINYAPYGDGFAPDDWVELYNPGDDTVHVAGWSLMDNDDAHRFDLPRDAIILPDDYLVLCRNSIDFMSHFPEVTTIAGDIGFGFTSGGELIRLLDGRSVIIDSLTFGSSAFWPSGPTISLTSPLSDNADPANWATSSGHGTPGSINGVINAVDTDLSAPATFVLGHNYPNPFNPRTIIPFSLAQTGHVTLAVYSLTGQCVSVLIDDDLTPGAHTAVFEPTKLATGSYIISLSVNGTHRTGTMLYLK